MTPHRIILLVTGSRTLDATEAEVVEELNRMATEHGLDDVAEVVVYHGACPHQRKGVSVDAVADGWARSRGWTAKPYPVTHGDWQRYGRRAGPRRNTRMVTDIMARPDVLIGKARPVCFALPNGRSRGTRDCMKRAAKVMHVAESMCWGPARQRRLF